MGKKEKNPNIKKPVYKKWWFWVIVVCLVGAVGSGLSGGNEPTEPPIDGTKTQDLASTPEANKSDNSIKSGNYTLPSGFDINFRDSVRNDVTGKWRISTTSDDFVPAEYAVEYYKTMFSSDDEIHAIWNATLGTTTRITVAFGVISADTLEYVEGEEHDAKVLFSGTLLDSKLFDAETGEEISE